MTAELLDGSIFLHVPKTGGTWIHEVLLDLKLVKTPVGGQKHAVFVQAVLYPRGVKRWKDLRRPENWSASNFIRSGCQSKIPFTFCFVRHPVRWYESWWRYMKGMGHCDWFENSRNAEGLAKRWTPGHLLYECFNPDFNTFVHTLHARFPGFVTWLYGQFATPEINFVGKQEHLVDDLIAVLRQRGLPFDEGRIRSHPRANKSNLSEQAAVWDPGLLREVQAAERPSLLRFGYDPIREPVVSSTPAISVA